MSDVSELSGQKNGAAANVVDGAAGSATALPPFVEGQLGKERAESLRKDIASDPELAKELSSFKGLPEVFDSWRAQRSSLKGTVRIPKEGDSKEVWDRYYKEIGRPESPDKYSLDVPNLPKGMPYSKQSEEWFRKQAHALGLTASTAKKLFSEFNTLQVQQFTAMQEAQGKAEADAKVTRDRELNETRSALRLQWGDAYDSRMPRNMAALKNPMMMPQDILETLDKSGILRKPSFHLWWDQQVSLRSSDRKLGLKGEEAEAVEEESTTTSADGKRHLKAGFFPNTARRNPARKRAV